MPRLQALLFLAAVIFSIPPARAVEYDINTGSYVTTPPDDTASGYSAPGWDTGWSGSGVTGWDYVGLIDGASGVYLGNGFVLTAAHVGAGNFTLDGTTYSVVANSAQNIGTADLTLFQISSSPELPALTLAQSTPTAAGYSAGSAVVMIGYGGGQGETWGENNVTQVNQTVTGISPYTSTDFYTLNGTYYYHHGTGSFTNTAQLVSGDSGGGDFIYNSTTGLWELAGINEAYLTDSNTNNTPVGSAMVQLSSYATAINADMLAAETTPEPPTWMLVLIPLLAAQGWSYWRRAYPRPRS
jgi:hypothetical protein